MSVELRTKSRSRKLPSVPAKVLSWVGEEGVTITDSKIKPDLNRFAKLPPDILNKLKQVENDNTIMPGQKFTDIPVIDDSDVSYSKTTKKGKNISIHVQKETFRRIAGIREFADAKNSYLVRKVEIRKVPEKSLGFYICEGDGWDRQDGIFVSRLVLGSYIEANGFLRVGDEILKVNDVRVKKFPLNDVALMMQVVEKLVLTVKVLTSVSHIRGHSLRLSLSSHEALSSAQFLLSTSENAITLTPPKEQNTTDPAPTQSLAEKTDIETTEVVDTQVIQNGEQPFTDMNKSLNDNSLLLSVSQALDEGFKLLDNSILTMVDVHNSMTQDGNQLPSEVYEMDVSPTAVANDLVKKGDDIPLPAAAANDDDDDEQSLSEGSNSDDDDSVNRDDTDFSLFKWRRKKRKKKKTAISTSDTYEVKKSFWQMQEESIAIHDRIDPIRDMDYITTTFTGKIAPDSDICNKESSCVPAVHEDTSADPSYGITVMIKVKSLSDISSFTPQNLFCCISANHIKKASTKVKGIQGTTVDFNELFYIDFLLIPSELQIAIYKPADVGDTDEHVISQATIKLPGVDREPEEISVEIDPTGVLTMEIQVLKLMSQ